MTAKVLYFVLGLALFGFAGYIAGDLQIWEFVISFMCVGLGLKCISESEVFKPKVE